jgi:hypothetical protein
MSFDWDNYTQTGDWARFDNEGDGIVGVIKTIREGADFNGNPCPELVLETDPETGDEITVTAGQVMLKAALAEQRPEEGDKIRIVYTGVGEARPGKAPAKLFTVEVKKGPHPVKEPAVANSLEDPF